MTDGAKMSKPPEKTPEKPPDPPPEAAAAEAPPLRAERAIFIGNSPEDLDPSIVSGKLESALKETGLLTEKAQERRSIRDQADQDNNFAAATLMTAGQRRVNLLWEGTQAFIAISVVASNMVGGLYFAFNRLPGGEYPSVLSSALFLVIGFYFSRTNHAAVGGVGAKAGDSTKYEGR